MEGLQTALILGRQRDIYFGMPAIQYVYEKISIESFSRLQTGNYQITDIKVIAHFVYAGLYGGAELNDERLDFSYKDVYAFVENTVLHGGNEGIMKAVGLAFSESTSLKYLKEKGKQKVSKKK